MSKIICSGVRKSYKDNIVLDGVDLEIEQGKIYGLIGRNGAGKTTLMSVMTAQTPADSGTIELDGIPVWENRKSLDRICFSREITTGAYSFYTSAKVQDLLDIAGLFYPNWNIGMADEILDRFHIRRKDWLSKLSKGMLSILTIAIGMASCADFTILDEPVAGLDVVAREEFYRLVIAENAKGRTFVISTHIIEEAADVFEDIIFLHNHRIMLQENTIDLLDRCRYVTGLSAEVDEAVQGLNVIKKENIGRSGAATVMLNAGERFPIGYDVTVQPISLQNLFVSMCGQELL